MLNQNSLNLEMRVKSQMKKIKQKINKLQDKFQKITQSETHGVKGKNMRKRN